MEKNKKDLTELEILYNSIETLKKGGLDVPDSLMQQMKQKVFISSCYIIIDKKLQYKRNMWKLWITTILTLLCVFLSSCSNMFSLTPEKALNDLSELSPTEGARFYIDNRTDNPFMDSLYYVSVLPAIQKCDYFTQKNVVDIIKDTPCHGIVEDWMIDNKSVCLNNISSEVKFNFQEEIETFNKSILTSLKLSLDSMIQEDVDNIMDKYAGGILNYRKIAFVFGRDRNDFKDMFWEKFDTLKYQSMIKSHIQTYLDSVKVKQFNYVKDVTGKDFSYNYNIKTPSFVIGLSQSTLKHVSKFTKGEKDNIIMTAFKDVVVPVALGTVSGGAGTLAELYDVANDAYDVKVLIDDIKSEKVDKDDMLKYICQHDISYQIDNYYLGKWIKQVYNQLEESNSEMYEFIKEEL